MIKHNKKRNVAFLFESLVIELSKSIFEKNQKKKSNIVKILKTHFSKNNILGKEYELYKNIYETQNILLEDAQRILKESIKVYKTFDNKVLFEKQSELIKDINKILDKRFYNNFVPNYKSLATISSLFKDGLNIKKKIIMENFLFEQMCAKNQEKEKLKPVDNLVMGRFVERYNKKYQNFTKKQSILIKEYINSFSDNQLSLKSYLNEEIPNIEQDIIKIKSYKFIKENELLKNQLNTVHTTLKEFKTEAIDKELILKISNVYELIKECQNEVNN